MKTKYIIPQSVTINCLSNVCIYNIRFIMLSPNPCIISENAKVGSSSPNGIWLDLVELLNALVLFQLFFHAELLLPRPRLKKLNFNLRDFLPKSKL